MKKILRSVLLCAAGCASARSGLCQEVGAYLGFGSAYDSSTGAQIGTFSNGTLYKTPGLGGLFGHIGGDVFFTPHLGVGGEISWRPWVLNYAGINLRPTFYNFDAIFRPSKGKTKGWEPEFRAGLGGARMDFFPNDPVSCSMVPGCPSSDHFQVHFAAAARWYVTSHFFLRPAVDVHYLNNLFEFGSNWVPEYSVGIGYSLGRGE